MKTMNTVIYLFLYLNVKNKDNEYENREDVDVNFYQRLVGIANNNC